MQEMPRKPTRKLILTVVLALALAALLFMLLGPRKPVQIISPERLAAIPAVSQGDYQEPVAVFAGESKSVQSSGCGAVCVAMAVNYLTGEGVSPDALFAWAVENNLYFGDGLGHEALTDMALEHGVKGEWIENDADPVIQALMEGYPVIAHMGPGTFTQNGHYILLIGVSEDGRILVNDPGSRERSGQAFEMDTIMKELRRANSFMILSM